MTVVLILSLANYQCPLTSLFLVIHPLLASSPTHFSYRSSSSPLILSRIPASFDPLHVKSLVDNSNAAYTANTLVALGEQAGHIFPPDYLGITSVPVADVWKAIGVPAGIFLWLLGFWFFGWCPYSTITTFLVAILHFEFLGTCLT